MCIRDSIYVDLNLLVGVMIFTFSPLHCFYATIIEGGAADRRRRPILVYIYTYIARNAVFYCLLVKANNAFFSCQLILLFCGRFERSGVQASCRAPHSIYQTRWPSHRCSRAGGVFSSRGRCVSVVTQRKVWTQLSKKSSKISFLNRARWSRRPFLVISTVENNEIFLNWRSLPDLGLLTKSCLLYTSPSPRD